MQNFHVCMLSARKENFSPTFGWQTVSPYVVYPHLLYNIKEKNSNSGSSVYSSYYVNYRLENMVIFVCFWKTLDPLMANGKQLRQIWHVRYYQGLFETQENALRRFVFSSHIRNNHNQYWRNNETNRTLVLHTADPGSLPHVVL